MSQISTQVQPDEQLTTLTAHGKVDIEMIIDAMKDIYEHSTPPTRYMLWDFSHADLSSVYGSDLKRLNKITMQFAHLRPDGKTAIVSTNDLGYGIGRQYSIIGRLNELPLIIDSFRSVDDAIEWLYSSNK
ncbi:MAG: hypothetical protein HUJ29_05140 [Gammaproteobacteria bacterium]|nr:hypothetical protein [Gammaproteobacteria bacterium]